MTPSTRTRTRPYILSREAGMNPSRLVVGLSYRASLMEKQLWNCSSPLPILQYTFECNQGAVLSIAVRGETIYAGCQDGYVKVLDLETRTLVRTIIVHEVNSLAFQMDKFLTKAEERRGPFPLNVTFRSLQRISEREDSGGWVGGYGYETVSKILPEMVRVI